MNLLKCLGRAWSVVLFGQGKYVVIVVPGSVSGSFFYSVVELNMEGASTSTCIVCCSPASSSGDVDSTVSVLGKRRMDSDIEDSDDDCGVPNEELDYVQELAACYDDLRLITRELYKINAQLYGPLHGVVLMFAAELRRLQNKSP